MPAKLRQAKALRRQFSRDVLELFIALEHSPKRGERFRIRERELMYQLNLIHEWWTGDSVLDRSATCAYEPHYIAFHHWHTCRRVRLELLASTASAVNERRDRASRQIAPN